MMKNWILAAFLLLGISQISNAQKINRDDFAKVRDYVNSLGPMEGHHLKYIVDTLTRSKTAPKAEQVYAIYYWIATNVDVNTRGMRHPGNFNPSASEALNKRSTNAEGYANLFKAMMDMSQTRSQVIKGMAKFDARNIGKLSNKRNQHAWNADEVDGVWYVLDLPWSAGKTDRKFRYFTPQFTDAWFMTDRELFALSHFPVDKKWQLLDTPINKSVFTQAPIVGTSAITNEVYPTTGIRRGNIRGKADTTKKMVFEVGNPSLIQSVSVTNRTSARIPAKYTFDGNMMYVEVPFKTEGDYPFNIYINDQLAYQYKATVGKAKKKPKPKPQAKAKKKPQPRKPTASKAPTKKKVAEAKPEKKEKTEKKEKPKKDRKAPQG